MKFKLILFIGSFFMVLGLNGQDPHFSQFYSNQLYLAPSFAGYTPGSRITTAYRNQWPKINNVFVTYSLGYDYNMETFNSGVGVFLLRDVAGTGELALLNAGVLYSYDFTITRDIHMRPGVQLKYTQMGIDYYKLIWGDQIINGIIGGGSIEDLPPGMFKPDVDFTASLLCYSDRFWGGFTIDHLLRPNYGLFNNEALLPLKFTAFGGYQLVKKQIYGNSVNESLTFSVLYQHQETFNQIIGGVHWYREPIIIGVSYRGIPLIGSNRDDEYRKDPMGDAVSVLFGYKINNIQVGYSYDFTVSNLVSSTGGAHELSITFEFKSDKKRKRRKMVPCPFPHPYNWNSNW